MRVRNNTTINKKSNTTKNNWLKNPVILLLAILASFISFFYYAFRMSFVFVDEIIFNGFSLTLFWFSILNAFLLFILALIKFYKVNNKDKYLCDTKGYKVIFYVSLGVVIFFIFYILASMIIMGGESITVAFNLLKEDIIYKLGAIIVAILIVLLPSLKDKKKIIFIAGVIVLGILFSLIFSVYPDKAYRITADPMVIDNCNNYSIVFATNDIGTGYVEYEYDGENYKIFDQSGGRLKGDSKIHTIEVPKHHLVNNSYKVGSKRVIDELSYGGRSGKEIVSDNYTFSVPKGENQSYLIVSDWHTYLKDAYKAIDNASDYDGVILLGDPAPGLMFEDEIKDYIVEFGGKLSKGTKPIVYVRGNHETRGRKASELLDYLGMDSFYYTIGYDNYEFLVLDSGEDKADNHPEYGGMNDYEQYRTDMVEWMKTLQKSDKKTIALVHSYPICIEKGLSDIAYDELKRLGINQIISGHIHTAETKEYNGINVYLDGGYMNGVFIASKLTFSEEGYLVEAWDSNNNKVLEKRIEW